MAGLPWPRMRWKCGLPAAMGAQWGLPAAAAAGGVGGTPSPPHFAVTTAVGSPPEKSCARHGVLRAQLQDAHVVARTQIAKCTSPMGLTVHACLKLEHPRGGSSTPSRGCLGAWWPRRRSPLGGGLIAAAKVDSQDVETASSGYFWSQKRDIPSIT